MAHPNFCSSRVRLPQDHRTSSQPNKSSSRYRPAAISLPVNLLNTQNPFLKGSCSYFDPNAFIFAGEQLLLHCGALTNCDDGEALIYWLVNGSFPEDALSRDRIVETHEWVFLQHKRGAKHDVRCLLTLICSRSSLMEGLILLKSLLLKNVTLEDFDSTFSCVVTNAVGMAQKYIKLAGITSGCSKWCVKTTESFWNVWLHC